MPWPRATVRLVRNCGIAQRHDSKYVASVSLFFLLSPESELGPGSLDTVMLPYVAVAVARRPPIARRLFFARVLESTGGRVESDSCDARHSKTAGDAAATCSRDLFAARDADVDAAGQPALDALLPGEREGKKGSLLACF